MNDDDLRADLRLLVQLCEENLARLGQFLGRHEDHLDTNQKLAETVTVLRQRVLHAYDDLTGELVTF